MSKHHPLSKMAQPSSDAFAFPNAAGVIGALSESEKRDSIKRHRDAGEWTKALRLARASDFTTHEMDELLGAAVSAIAPHAIPVKQGGFKGMPNATEPNIAASLSLQWLLLISDGRILAEACSLHLSKALP